jgi:DNA-binding transcriptional LysR family regulator
MSIDLNDIRLLTQVIEHGSYTAASRAVGVPKSTISQRVAALERVIGTGLLRRTSRAFSLTEAGALLLPHARAVEELAKKIEQVLLQPGREFAGTLRVSCSNAIAQFVICPLIPRFLSQNPEATIRLEATNRIVDVIGEGFDITIPGHSERLRDSTLLQRVVARTPWSIIAAPSWVGRNGMPTDPSDLSSVEALYFRTSHETPTWTLGRGDEKLTVRVSPRLISDDMAALRASVLAGGGVACLPNYIVGAPLRRGQLVAILPNWSPPSSTITLLTPPKTQSSRLARAFSDFVTAELARGIHSSVRDVRDCRKAWP